MKKEIKECYRLIHRLGRGVVYLGSSRMGHSHPHYTQAFELGREVNPLIISYCLQCFIKKKERKRINPKEVIIDLLIMDTLNFSMSVYFSFLEFDQFRRLQAS